jgi:UDP-N-acetylglucosamine 2-epimerase (non-hydrolysing)
MKDILLIAGTRPNFIKLAPLFHRIKEKYLVKICHTGQHFDSNMSDTFWHSLNLPEPDFKLNTSGGNVSDIIGKTILGLSEILKNNKFDCVIVFGDVNATVAGAITSVQSGIKLMHVEAGLRSYDRRMPEEINRIITDHISDVLFVSEQSGLVNLKKEGIPDNKVNFVGNIMIENLINTREFWEKLPSSYSAISKNKYFLATFHRPENVDDKNSIQKIISIINNLAEEEIVLFPIHPRTKNKLIEYDYFNFLEKNKNIIITEPLGYFEFIKLVSEAFCVITDSGGIQEETSYLNIPCITFRNNTERPITIEIGTNVLLNINETNLQTKIYEHISKVTNSNGNLIPLWDNLVSARILDVIDKI